MFYFIPEAVRALHPNIIYLLSLAFILVGAGLGIIFSLCVNEGIVYSKSKRFRKNPDAWAFRVKSFGFTIDAILVFFGIDWIKYAEEVRVNAPNPMRLSYGAVTLILVGVSGLAAYGIIKGLSKKLEEKKIKVDFREDIIAEVLGVLFLIALAVW